MTLPRAKAMAIGIAICFLLIHVLVINVFYQCGVTPMVKFNIFSIIFYLIISVVAYKGLLQVYCVAVYLEVVLHMTFAIFYTGWDSDFQVTLIGMNVLAMYGEYVGRTLKLKYIPMLPFCFLGMGMYLGTYVYIHFNKPLYTLPDSASFWLSIIWGIIVFLISGFVLVTFVIIARSSEIQLENQMYHDKLTGLPNRYYMADYMNKLTVKNKLSEYWIAIADIDDFKKINDTFGHNCGDYVLETLGNILTENEDILCCRWGGEEFIFISNNRNDAFDSLDKYRQKIENYQFNFNDIQFNVTITVGIAKFDNEDNIDTIISRADQKLYLGKEQGKNRVII